MRCARCQESCSQRGHIRGKELSRTANVIVYDCVRCDLNIVQDICECCAAEVGTQRTEVRG